MKKIGLLLLLIIISLCACDTNSTKPDEEEIRNIIYDISRDFCWNDINGIMEYVHKDFRHNGMYRDELRLLWNERRNKYQLLDCDISQIYIHNEYATVFMTMTYQSATETVTFLSQTLLVMLPIIILIKVDGKYMVIKNGRLTKSEGG